MATREERDDSLAERRRDEEPSQDSHTASRRRWLRETLALAAGAAGLRGGPAWAEDAQSPSSDAQLIVRSLHPLDLETPVSAFDRFLTPNDLFFVRTHFPEPAESRGPWTLAVGGKVKRELRLSPADVQAMPQHALPAVLQCSGNGRSLYAPRVPGVGWARGAVGNAEWAGVRLADLLGRAGLDKAAAHIHFLGADAPPNPRTPVYLRSLPVEKALDPNTLVATRMNGQPLPWLHGGPLRLIVPGWSGNHWMKWLRKIEASDVEAPGAYQQTSYRMPRTPVAPGVDVKLADMLPITTMNVKSLIARPAEGARLRAGRHEVQGVAWTGAGHVTKVEVAIGEGGVWHTATLEGEPREFAWRLWRYAWNAEKPGQYALRVRATDSSGATQPETPPWNKSGYLWNGIDQSTCEIV